MAMPGMERSFCIATMDLDARKSRSLSNAAQKLSNAVHGLGQELIDNPSQGARPRNALIELLSV